MILAADIGGTKIAAARIHHDGTLAGDVLQAPTPADQGPAAVLAATEELLVRLDAPDVTLVGVASAGVIDPDRGVVLAATASLPGWAGTSIAAHLAGALRRPVYVLGDGHAFGVGIARHGVGRGHDHLLLLAAGTGVGGSYLVRGQPLLGAHHVAGHVGHLAVSQAAGVRCPCGRTGHLEAVAGGAGMVDLYRARGGDERVDSTTALLARVADDPLAREALHLAGEALGTAAGGLANVLDPDLVVVAGGLTQAGPVWEDPLRAAFADTLLPALAQLPLHVSSEGTALALRGVATYAWERHHRD